MKLKLLALLVLPATIFAQGYTSYFTGSTTNITTQTTPGTCLMGGAAEHDNAMLWLLERANGGDVVVLRSSGSDGYNDYLYSELGVNVNSVETLVITSVAGATDPYVLDKVANAEMIWFAGGDQWNYVSFFKDNALEDLLNAHVNVKQAPIGGTSAGMAILGGKYFSAQYGSVSSAQALMDPSNPNVSVMFDDFLSVPYLTGVITDTHYDNPDRRGRHVAFIARLKQTLTSTYGIAANEYVAICIDENGIARVYGDYPNYDEFAYFIQPNCQDWDGPEVFSPGTPLTWNFNGEALQVYKVPGTMNGEHYFDLNGWTLPEASGGTWEHWYVVNGALNVTAGTEPDCMLGIPASQKIAVGAYPNPFNESLSVSFADAARIKIYDAVGKPVYETTLSADEPIDTSAFSAGFYIAEITTENGRVTEKLVKM